MSGSPKMPKRARVGVRLRNANDASVLLSGLQMLYPMTDDDENSHAYLVAEVERAARRFRDGR